jgi:hypothetical protein
MGLATHGRLTAEGAVEGQRKNVELLREVADAIESERRGVQ